MTYSPIYSSAYSPIGFGTDSTGTGVSASGPVYIATNGNAFPYSTNTATTDNVQHYFKKRRVAGGNYKKLKFTYPNFFVGNGFETNGNFAITLRMGVRDNSTGIWYPGWVNGSRDAVVAPGSSVTFEVPNIPATNGKDLTECVRVIGPSASSEYLLSHATVAYREEGSIVGTDTSLDLTLGGTNVGYGATGTAVLTGDTLTSVTATTGGSGYGAFGLIYFVCNQAGGQDADYAATTSSGVYTGGYPNAFGSGFVSAPVAYVNSNFSKDTAIYAAAIVSGELLDGTEPVSMVICGDSIARGFTSSDAYGDPKGNFGIFERKFNSAFGILNMSIAGMTVLGFEATKQKAALIANGAVINHAVMAAGINDVTAGTTFSNLATAQKALADYWRNTFAAEIIFATLLPSTTGTFTGDPSANQVANTGADLVGVRTDYNTAVRTGSDSRLRGDYPCLDVALTMQDATYPWAWNGSAGIALTSDGSHPRGWSDAPAAKTGTTYNFFPTRGIEYFVTNFITPTYYADGFSLTDISSLKALFDATNYATLTFNSTTISTWGDASGNSNNAVQATASKQPLYVANGINGKPAIRGKHDNVDPTLATGSVMRAADAASLDFVTFEVFVLAKRVGDTGANSEMFGKYTASSGLREWRIYYATGASGALGGGVSHDGNSVDGSFNAVPALSTGTPYVFGYRFDGTSRILSVNGTDIDTDTQTLTPLNNNTALLDLFGREATPAEPFAGDITVAAFFNTVLSTADRAKVIARLKYMGGIA